ncbi:hypothetical protein T261_08864 [Streptomyces lydicus]|nr:hypothetical protein T261_08864 [Streptomyces lydicus]
MGGLVSARRHDLGSSTIGGGARSPALLSLMNNHGHQDPQLPLEADEATQVLIARLRA